MKFERNSGDELFEAMLLTAHDVTFGDLHHGVISQLSRDQVNEAQGLCKRMAEIIPDGTSNGVLTAALYALMLPAIHKMRGLDS